ncbi:MAG: hypothetical protein ACXVZ1_02545 [Gaiellaceae bacterium]
MEEARAVIARLDRIDLLERTGEAPARVLEEIGLLLEESRAWLEREVNAPEPARAALERCRETLARRCLRSASVRPA